LVNSDDHFFILNDESKIVSINETAKNLLSYAPHEILGKSFFDFLKDGKLVRNCFENLSYDDVLECEVEFVLKNGASVKTTIESLRFKLDDAQFVLIRLKNGKEDLKAVVSGVLKEEIGSKEITALVERYFRLIEQELQLGIWEVDLDNNRVYWSNEVYELLGRERTTKPSVLPLSEYVHEEDREYTAKVFYDTLQKEGNYKLTYRVVRPDGEIRYLEEYAIYLEDEHRRYFLGLDVDVTDRERYQRELLRQKEIAERMRRQAEELVQAKNRFLSSMSHEVRTLLNAILGYSQILKNDPSLGEKQKRMVESVLISAGYLLDIINDILEMSKMELGKNRIKPVEFNLTNMLKSLYNIFSVRAQNKGIGWYIVGMPEEDFIVKTDKTKLFHALLNLIGNAIKFTEKGEVKLVFRYRDGKCYFEIDDTGIGIDESIKEKIFEPFVQNAQGFERGGSGLGLSIANVNVKMLDGELRFESEVGKGTKFFFEIPCARLHNVKIGEKDQNRSYRLKKGEKFKVLIVDDNENNREILKNYLRLKGMEVVVAENGEEGVRSFMEHSPDVVFMDINMPMMDGFESAKTLRSKRKDVKIVALSSSKESEDVYEPFDEVMQKPYDLQKIEKFLASSFANKFEEINEEPIVVKLPETLRHEIYTMAEIGDISGLKRAIGEIEDEKTRKLLANNLRNFSLDRIMDLVSEEEKREKNNG
jgi:PAS domain S-box-containing protein